MTFFYIKVYHYVYCLWCAVRYARQTTRRSYIRSSRRPYSGNRFGCLVESFYFHPPFYLFASFEMSYGFNYRAFEMPTFEMRNFVMPEMPFSIPSMAAVRATLPSVSFPNLDSLKQAGKEVQEKALSLKKYIHKKPVKVTAPRRLIGFDVDTARLFNERTQEALTIQAEAEKQVEEYKAESIEVLSNASKALEATKSKIKLERKRHKEKMLSLRAEKNRNIATYTKIDEERQQGLEDVKKHKSTATDQQTEAMQQHLALMQAMNGGVRVLQDATTRHSTAASHVGASDDIAAGGAEPRACNLFH